MGYRIIGCLFGEDWQVRVLSCEGLEIEVKYEWDQPGDEKYSEQEQENMNLVATMLRQVELVRGPADGVKCFVEPWKYYPMIMQQ